MLHTAYLRHHISTLNPIQSRRPCLRHAAQHSRQVPAHHPGEQRPVRGAAFAGRRHHRRGAPQEVHRMPHMAAAHQGAAAAAGGRIRCGRCGHGPGQRRRRSAGRAESDCRLMRVARGLPAAACRRFRLDFVCKLGCTWLYRTKSQNLFYPPNTESPIRRIPSWAP